MSGNDKGVKLKHLVINGVQKYKCNYEAIWKGIDKNGDKIKKADMACMEGNTYQRR